MARFGPIVRRAHKTTTLQAVVIVDLSTTILFWGKLRPKTVTLLFTESNILHVVSCETAPIGLCAFKSRRRPLRRQRS